jgi:transcriptional repressor NrdR
MQVRKNDGTLEAFMPEKVVVSIVKSGAPYTDARNIADSLSKSSSSVMESSKIRDHIHSELKSRGLESVVNSWNEYDSEMKRDRMESSAGRAPHAQSTHRTAA